MNARYTGFKPLTNDELETFSNLMVYFFSPNNHGTVLKELNPNDNRKLPIQPLSIGLFLDFLKIRMPSIEDPIRYWKQVRELSSKLTTSGILTYMGMDGKGSAPFNICYYSMFEKTKLQENNSFWLGSSLGLSFLSHLCSKFVVSIIGKNSNGDVGIGSGIIINNDTILTCKHNLEDLNEIKCDSTFFEIKIIETFRHKVCDIGLIKIEKLDYHKQFPYFGEPIVLDKVLTMGYPPLTGIKDHLVVSQTGEINAIGTEYFTGCECIVISSITRPGNSGGPVFSKSGYIVGIVIRSSNTSTQFGGENDKERESSTPFYLAISSNELRRLIPEVLSSVQVNYEEYY